MTRDIVKGYSRGGGHLPFTWLGVIREVPGEAFYFLEFKQGSMSRQKGVMTPSCVFRRYTERR